MNAFQCLLLAVLLCLGYQGWSQSTTAGRSGGSTASTGATYSTSDPRAVDGSPASMTVADEGASSGYILGPRVDPDQPTNFRAKSPDGSSTTTDSSTKAASADSVADDGGLPGVGTSGNSPRQKRP